jgi:hypothetical protein
MAVTNSILRPNALKGSFGEAHMERHLAKQLGLTGKWVSLPARLGPHGLDGMAVQFDSAGEPCKLVVSEAKYGTGRLQMTSDGIQMGTAWRNVRLGRMASEYESIARSIRSGAMGIAGPGGSVGHQRLQLPLPDGKAAVFTRANSRAPWTFVGPPARLADAGRRAASIGDFLRLASEGKVEYESFLYRNEISGGKVTMTVKDASLLGTVSESGLPVRSRISIPIDAEQLGSLRNITRAEMSKRIRQVYPHISSTDADRYATQWTRSTKDIEKLHSTRPRPLLSSIAATSLIAGAGAAAIDTLILTAWEFSQSGTVSWRRLGPSAGVAFGAGMAGGAAGQGAAVFLTKNPVAYQFMARTSSILGLGTAGLAARTVGSAIGMGVAGIFLGYGGLLAGLNDSQTANRMAVAGVASFGAAALTAPGMFALASMVGTASTGTAIGSLSGASATSASLAWLGGGSLASGGGGMALGSAVVSGGAALAAIAAAGVVVYGISFLDERTDCERIRLTSAWLTQKETFDPGRSGGVRYQTAVIAQPQ